MARVMPSTWAPPQLNPLHQQEIPTLDIYGGQARPAPIPQFRPDMPMPQLRPAPPMPVGRPEMQGPPAPPPNPPMPSPPRPDMAGGGLAGMADPRMLGLLGAGGALMGASAPSRVPVSTGQALSGAMQGGLGGYAMGNMMNRQAKRDELLDEILRREVGMSGAGGGGGGLAALAGMI